MQTRALQIALATPSIRGHRGVPVILWGPPGVGKTSVVEAIGEAMGLPVKTIIASIHDPTDFGGLPIALADRVKFLPPSWIVDLVEAGDAILFLDELTTAPPAVQAALLRLVQERRIGDIELPEGVAIVAAANPPEIGGNELSDAMANRFVHLQWNITPDELVSGLTAGWGSIEPLPYIDEKTHREAIRKWKSVVASLISRNTSLASTRPAERKYAFASPRSWEVTAHLAATCELTGDVRLGESPSETFVQLMMGALGSGAAMPFIQFVKTIDIPDPRDVLNGVVNPPALNDDALFVLINEMFRLCEETEDQKWWKRLFEILAKEYDNQRDIIMVPLIRALRSRNNAAVRNAIKAHPKLADAVSKRNKDVLSIARVDSSTPPR